MKRVNSEENEWEKPTNNIYENLYSENVSMHVN